MLEKETINVVQDGPLVADSEVIEYDTKPRTGEDNVRKFLVEADESAELTEEDSKRLLRKIDYRIMPFMLACYTLQYLDKTLINYSHVMGMLTDTGITADQYSYMAMVFYISYLFAEIPTGYLMQRFPTARYIAINVICWGSICAGTSGITNFAELTALRVLLGLFESAVAPSLIIISSMWYLREEQPFRIGIWYTGVGWGTIIGSLLSYGFQFMPKEHFKSWQILFLVVGMITVAVGMLVFVFLPNNPMTASFLTKKERLQAIHRIESNKTGIENKTFKPHQAREALTDLRVWVLLIVVTASSVSNGAVSSYSATIIKNIGFTSKQSALLSIPSGVISAISVLVMTYLATKGVEMTYCAILCLIPGIIGGCLLSFVGKEHHGPLLAGAYLIQIVGSALPVYYSFASTNTSGHSKKIIVNAMLLIAFCVGNIIGPLTFTGATAPEYLPAKVAIVITLSIACFMLLVLKALYMIENRRRDRLPNVVSDVNWLDLTDKENLSFRYRY